MTRLPRALVVCKRFDDDSGFRTTATALVTPDAVLRLEDNARRRTSSEASAAWTLCR